MKLFGTFAWSLLSCIVSHEYMHNSRNLKPEGQQRQVAVTTGRFAESKLPVVQVYQIKASRRPFGIQRLPSKWENGLILKFGAVVPSLDQAGTISIHPFRWQLLGCARHYHVNLCTYIKIKIVPDYEKPFEILELSKVW